MTLPCLVYHRWTDPAALQHLRTEGRAELLLHQLDLAGPEAASWSLLASAHGYQVATRTDVAGLAGGDRWLAGADTIARSPELLALCTAGAGYDVVDLDAATAAGVIVCNNSGPGAEAVAEHALGFMLDLAKRITLSDRVLRRGDLGDRLALQGTELGGKTVGVIGLGAIGGRLVELCRPFGMEVLVHDPYLDDAGAQAAGVTRTGLDDLLRRADFVQVTCPLTPETEGLIGEREFALMKPTAFFVTTARGQVHDEQALYRALVAGSIAGAGLDVFHDEPPTADNPLLALDTVVATPHTAGITVEAARAIALAGAEQWLQIFRGKVPPRLLNPAAWPRYSDRFEAAFGFRPAALEA